MNSSPENRTNSAPVVHLMYHEMEVPGRPLANPTAGYMRYAVRADSFLEHMSWVKNIGWEGMNVSQAIEFPHADGVAVTFDDGCETDLTTASPALKQLGFSATFYITVSYLGQAGFLSRTQLRELNDEGFEIGCHGLTHRYLTDLTRQELERELASAKAELEQIIGRRVDHLSCPGGRWNRQVANLAQQIGFRSVATSRPRANGQDADRYRLGRVAVVRETTIEQFQALCRGDGLWKLQLRELVREGGRRALGNSRYDRLRSFLLDRRSER